MHSILIEMYRARHGDQRYDLTFDDEHVYEGMTLIDMLAVLMDWMANPEDE